MEQYIALAQETWVSFDALAESWSRQAVSWAHPNFPYDERPTAGWPLTRLSSALAISVVYLVLVAYGLIRRGSKSEDEDEKGKPLGFFAGLRKEPIKLLQIVYNTAQVGNRSNHMGVAALPSSAPFSVWLRWSGVGRGTNRDSRSSLNAHTWDWCSQFVARRCG